jgi:hypothetical protein
MVVEIRGKRLRVRVAKPRKGCIYRTQLLAGRKGHGQRIAMYCPKTGKWVSQSFTFPLTDIAEGRKSTIQTLRKLGASMPYSELKKVI